MLSLRTKTPIIPTYIHGTFGIWPKGQKLPSIFGKKTTCIFGKPILPEEFAGRDDAHIALRVQEEIFNLQQWHTQMTSKFGFGLKQKPQHSTIKNDPIL